MANQLVRQYQFVSTWQFETSIQSVWSAFKNPADWPQWWDGLSETSNKPAAEFEVGQQINCIWSTKVGYKLKVTLTMTKFETNKLIEFTAAGDLVGTGSSVLSSDGNMTTVVINWDVHTTKLWMNRYATFLAPIFKVNHAQIMAAGESGLSRWLKR